MQKKNLRIATLACVFLSLAVCAIAQPESNPYPTIAPLQQYLAVNQRDEFVLARTAAPASISDAAAVMVLTPSGYKTVAHGINGFVCLVERSWGTSTDDPQFWNPKMRAPHCMNAAAAKTFLPIYLEKTKLVLAGKSKPQIAATIASELNSGELPALAPGAMAYMMSKQQYLNDRDKSWHPHVMFYAPGNVAKTWGANFIASPIIAASDPQERATIFMMVTSKWSDGTPAPPISY